MAFKRSPIMKPPAKNDKIILSEPTPVKTKTNAPNRHAIVEVSPIDPGIIPTKDSHAVYSLEKL